MKNIKIFVKKRGSILAYSLIILSVMMVITVSMSFVAVTEKKSASTTDASVQSYQTADSGMQLIVNKVTTKQTSTLDQMISGLADISCADGKITGTVGGGTFVASFYSDENATAPITDCNTTLASSIKNIKSTGTFNNTNRAVQVALASSQPCDSPTLEPKGTVYTCNAWDGAIPKADTFLKYFYSSDGHLLELWYGSAWGGGDPHTCLAVYDRATSSIKCTGLYKYSDLRDGGDNCGVSGFSAKYEYIAGKL